MHEHLDELRERSALLKPRVEELRKQRATLVPRTPIPELIAYRDELARKGAEEQQQKTELIQMAEGITCEDAERSQKEFRMRCEQWMSRKNKCTEMLDMLYFALDKKPAQIIKELELEQDEAKLKFKDKQFKVIEWPKLYSADHFVRGTSHFEIESGADRRFMDGEDRR